MIIFHVVRPSIFYSSLLSTFRYENETYISNLGNTSVNSICCPSSFTVVAPP